MADLTYRASASESFSVTVSIGVAEYDYHPDYKLLIEKADSALYYAKVRARKPGRSFPATYDKRLIFRHCHSKAVDPNRGWYDNSSDN